MKSIAIATSLPKTSFPNADLVVNSFSEINLDCL
jgi:hypothetical protein